MSRVSAATTPVLRTLDRWRRRGILPVVLCVDVEPDLRSFPRDAPCAWSGFESFIRRVPPLREGLAEATGGPVAFNWFLRMDPQIADTWGSPHWVVDSYGAELDALLAAGDELGVHTHTWRWSDQRGTWLADYADDSWARHCLLMGLDAFATGFGRRCRSHRSGDHLLTGPLLEVLGQREVEVDLTIEPGWPPFRGYDGEPTVGMVPDYRKVPLHPYWSSPARFPHPDPGGGGPLLVPLYSPPALRRRHRLPLPPDSRHFVSRLAVEMLRRPPRALALVLRSDPDALQHWDRVTANLHHLARHRGVRFLPAADVAERIGASGPQRP